MKKNTIIFMIVIYYILFFNVKYLYSLGFSLEDFKSTVKARIASTGKRDMIYTRVPNGQSCVEASDARAHEIAALVKSMQFYGRFGLVGSSLCRTNRHNDGPPNVPPLAAIAISGGPIPEGRTLLDSLSYHSQKWSQNRKGKVQHVGPGGQQQPVRKP